jgi:hypothetical protein
MKSMARADVAKILASLRCRIISDRGPHTKWGCPCGQHTANVPRHRVISPGVVRDIQKRMNCLGEGWLQ